MLNIRDSVITAEEADELRHKELTLVLGGMPVCNVPTGEEIDQALILRGNAEKHLVDEVRKYFPGSRPEVKFKPLGTAFMPKTIADGIELRPMFIVEFSVEPGNKENLRNYRHNLLNGLKEKFKVAGKKVEIIEDGGNKGNITDSDRLKFSVSGFNTHIIEAMEEGKGKFQGKCWRGI